MFHKYLALLFLSCIIASCGAVSTPADTTSSVFPTGTAGAPTGSTQNSDEVLNENTSVSLDNLNRIPPSDIIQEINFYGGMGGCGRFCACYQDFPKPTLISEESPIELFQSIGFEVCGIKPNEIVHVSVNLPDGSKRQFDIDPREGIVYSPDWRDPIGNYRFVFSGEDWTLEKTIEVKDASGTRLYLTKDQKQIIFYKFSPNEKVRLVAYDIDGKMIGWDAFVVDGNGQLSIKNDLKNADFVAIGAVSGQVFHRDEGEWINWSARLGYPVSDVYCANSSSLVGLRPDGFAEIVVDSLPIYNLNLDDSWSETGKINQAKGITVSVHSNPKCVDGKFLWKVYCTSIECNGWVPESGPDGPYLRPLKELPPSPTPDLSKIPACPGAKATRLKPGIQAKVSKVATQLSLRDNPGVNSNKVHVIASGRKMSILSELPVCADGAFWWHVYVDELGFGGWVREGDNNDYWIDPLP